MSTEREIYDGLRHIGTVREVSEGAFVICELDEILHRHRVCYEDDCLACDAERHRGGAA